MEEQTELTDEEFERLKQEVKDLENKEELEKKKAILRERLKKAKFRKKHKKILGITEGLEQGTKRVFKTLGSGMKKVGEGLAKSDQWVAEQQAKERKAKKRKKSDIREALDLVD